MEYNKVTNSELKNISRGYGMKMHPIKKIMKMHSGIDIPVSTGHDIYAIADGTVVDSEIRKKGCGGTIKVDHGVIDGKKIETRFCHCSQLLKQKGDKVKKGDVIAKSGGGKGDTGQGESTGSHIHFEVYENGKTVDPMKYYTGGQNFQAQNSTTNQPINNNDKIEIPQIPNVSDSDDLQKILNTLNSSGDLGNDFKKDVMKRLLSKTGLGKILDLIPKQTNEEKNVETKLKLIEEEIKRIKTLLR